MCASGKFITDENNTSESDGDAFPDCSSSLSDDLVGDDAISVSDERELDETHHEEEDSESFRPRRSQRQRKPPEWFDNMYCANAVITISITTSDTPTVTEALSATPAEIEL